MKLIINTNRVKALVIRHLFSWFRSWERVADAFWWPTFDLFIWGLVTIYLQQRPGPPSFFLNLFLGGIVMWMFVYRSQQEIGLTFLQEAWDRNLLSLFASPLTIWEFNLATLILGAIKLAISIVWMLMLGYLLFAFNLFQYGWELIPYALNLLVVGWSSGLVINGLIVRYGYRVQVFAWTLVAIIQPFSAVFYPVSAMPVWMQIVAKILPTSYIFEGMRLVMAGGSIEYLDLTIATTLNIVYLLIAVWFFQHCFEKARESGMLVKFS